MIKTDYFRDSALSEVGAALATSGLEDAAIESSARSGMIPGTSVHYMTSRKASLILTKGNSKKVQLIAPDHIRQIKEWSGVKQLSSSIS